MKQASFVKHISCDECGSSDANALYSDGHTYCFACQTTKNSTDTPKTKKIHMEFAGEFKGIPERGITRSTCEKFGVTQTSDKHYYPYANAQGTVVAAKVRDVEKKDFSITGSWKEAALFGQHLFLQGGKYVTLVEGELDALAAFQMTGSQWPV